MRRFVQHLGVVGLKVDLADVVHVIMGARGYERVMAQWSCGNWIFERGVDVGMQWKG